MPYAANLGGTAIESSSVIAMLHGDLHPAV